MHWNPTQFFCASTNNHPAPFALLVLNHPINDEAFSVLREHAHFTICADGGANRFYDLMRKRGNESTTLPDAIVGDLDSIHTSIRSHYEQLGVTIVQDPDQYSTDFTKSLKYIQGRMGEIITSSTKKMANDDRMEIVILGGLGGRVDQAFSQIHHLYLMTREYSSNQSAGNLYLVSEESLTFILQEGKNTVSTPGTNRPEVDGGELFLEENVGIIPLSGPARITTNGFEWDVENWHTEVGGQLSTSNHIRADVVEVYSDVPILFTVELADRFKRVR